jgi:hypothetical protein
MHTAWQLPLAVAGLVLLLLQLLEVGAEAATGPAAANHQAQSLRRSKVRAVSAKEGVTGFTPSFGDALDP